MSLPKPGKATAVPVHTAVTADRLSTRNQDFLLSIASLAPRSTAETPGMMMSPPDLTDRSESSAKASRAAENEARIRLRGASSLGGRMISDMSATTGTAGVIFKMVSKVMLSWLSACESRIRTYRPCAQSKLCQRVDDDHPRCKDVEGSRVVILCEHEILRDLRCQRTSWMNAYLVRDTVTHHHVACSACDERQDSRNDLWSVT